MTSIQGVHAFRRVCSTLKLFVASDRLEHTAVHTRVYFSWLSAHAGSAAPLTEEEVSYVRDTRCDIILTGSQRHTQHVEAATGIRAAFLPMTAFVDTEQFRPDAGEREIDLMFMCAYDLETVTRKRALLLVQSLSLLHSAPRVVWIGGTNIDERVSDEAELRGLVQHYGDGSASAALCVWEPALLRHSLETPSSRYASRSQRTLLLQYLKEEVARRGLDVTFYTNLCRADVAALLRRSKVSVVLAKRDVAPRAITEAIASGCFVIASEDLIAGLDFVTHETGIAVAPTPHSVARAIADVLSRNARHADIAGWFRAHWGYDNCMRHLLSLVEDTDWHSIVSMSRPYEAAVLSELTDLATSR